MKGLSGGFVMATEGAEKCSTLCGMVGSCRESEDCYSEIEIRALEIQQKDAKLKNELKT